jgi:hypothetical protein
MNEALETPQFFQSILVELSKNDNRKSWAPHHEKAVSHTLDIFRHPEPNLHALSLNPIGGLVHSL